MSGRLQLFTFRPIAGFASPPPLLDWFVRFQISISLAEWTARFFLAALLGLLGVESCGATIPYQVVERWTASDGLPTETVTGLVIDGEDQLWLASSDGVVRYQGFDFRHFHRGSEPALPRNRVMAVHAAPVDGVILHFDGGHFGYLNEDEYRPIGRADVDHISVFDGRAWFVDAETGALASWDSSSGLAVHDMGPLSSLKHDGFADRLLLGTRDGRVLALASSRAPAPTLVAHINESVLGVAAGSEGQLLVLGATGAAEVWPAESLPNANRRFGWEREQTRALRASWTQRGWLIANLFTDGGVGPNLMGHGTIERLPVLQPDAIDANRSPDRIEFFGSQGHRWINDGTRLYRDGQLVFQSEERISNFVVDPYGQLWIAHPRGGVRLLKQNSISTFGGAPGQLPDTNIYMVTEWKDQILIANWMGLTRFDISTDQWTQLLTRDVTDVLPGEDGLLVAGPGICTLSAPGECREVADFPAPDASVLLLHRDKRGALWVGTEDGLYRRDSLGDWTPEPLDRSIVRTVHEDDLGRLTFGTRGQGLLMMSVEDGGDSGPLGRIGVDEGLASGFVRALLGLSGGGILVGTEDAGLCLLDQQRVVVSCLSTEDGLPHHSVHYMVVDGEERLWVNTNDGIYRIALDSLLPFFSEPGGGATGFYRYGVRDGLPSVEGNGGVHRAGAMTDDGRIWFPNQFGLIAIRPDLDTRPDHRRLTPRVRVAGATTGNPVRLPADGRHVELELTAISLASPENVHFRYRFSPADDWVALGNQRNLNFRDLRPGRHRIEVDARHVNGPWSDSPAQLQVFAGYRFHEHPVSHSALVAIGVMTAVVVLLRVRRRRRSLEAQIDETSNQLAEASDQVATLGQSLRQVDVEHRSALHAISIELKSALDAAFRPLLEHRGASSATREDEGVRKQSRLLRALIDQIARFGEDPERSLSSVPSDKARGDSRDESNQPDGIDAAHELAESDNTIQLIRMEVLLHLADSGFSVEQLANRLGMSRSVLYRRVSECHGSSPAELIRDIRLERAAELLIESDEQVSTIAFSTGFRSVSAFSRAFTRKMGASPRSWRSVHSER